MKVSVIGAGSWGTALSQVLANNGHNVGLWARKPEVVKAINSEHKNPRYLSDVELNPDIVATLSYRDTLLRARAAAAGITEITQKDGAILLSLATMDFAAISACCAEAQFKGRIFFSAGKVPMLSVKLKKGEDALKLATQLVGTYAAMRAQTAEG